MMQNNSQKDRFLDEGIPLKNFSDEFLVVCPKCGKLARVVSENLVEKDEPQLFSPRKLYCLSCPHRALWKGKTITTGTNVDWYFRLPLWLQISCANETLWAYNLNHLQMIEKYVSAKLRQRTRNNGKSFISKLPGWIKSAKNRDEILRAIQKLRNKE